MCRAAIDAVVHQLHCAVKMHDVVDLVLPDLGVFKCKRVCDFDFGTTDQQPVAESVVKRDMNHVADVDERPYRQEVPQLRPSQVQSQWQSEPESLERLKEDLRAGGSDGIHSIGRVMRIMDDNKNKKLSQQEFRNGLADYGVRMNPVEVSELFNFFDKDRSGSISFDEFLVGLRRPMSKRRVDLIKIAFGRLDKNGDGSVTVEDIEMAYDAAFIPT